MPSKTLDVLLDIRDNIFLARQIVEGLTPEGFEQNRILFYAATRALEIISEATRRLPQEMRERHSNLPWRDIMDAGNFYRHQYDNVAERYVWRTIHQHLDPLLAMVEQELRGLGELP
jgi:uncharacterized protein with HEPN domain